MSPEPTARVRLLITLENNKVHVVRCEFCAWRDKRKIALSGFEVYQEVSSSLRYPWGGDFLCLERILMSLFCSKDPTLPCLILYADQLINVIWSLWVPGILFYSQPQTCDYF